MVSAPPPFIKDIFLLIYKGGGTLLVISVVNGGGVTKGGLMYFFTLYCTSISKNIRMRQAFQDFTSFFGNFRVKFLAKI